MATVLEVEDVHREFRSRGRVVQALRAVSLAVGGGECVGVLGLNGAGKTTLVKIVATLLLPTAGRVRLDGVDVVADPRAARRRLAVVFGGDRGLYNRLSATDNARFFATIGGLPARGLRARVDAALEAVGLGREADRPVETFSKGMRQRLHLAIGLMGHPQLLLLDEPTVGLDPLEAQRVRGVVGELRDRGVTVILTSHYLADIEQLADRVALLQEGELTHDMPLAAFLRQASFVATVRILGSGPEPPAPDGAALRSDGDTWTLTFDVEEWRPDSLRRIADAWPATGDRQRQILDVRVAPVTLERVFEDLASRAGGR